MVRAILKPNTPRISLSIPSEYVGEEVEVLVFPVSNTVNSLDIADYSGEQCVKRQEAFNNFMKYKGILPVDFDYKKELDEYRNERYGHIT
jgi:hypothetical protein